MEENINSQREMEILERFAETTPAEEILEITQDMATRLAVALSDVKHSLGDEDELEYREDLIRRVGKLAVLLDVIQIRFGDAVEEEIAFLQKIEESMEEQ